MATHPHPAGHLRFRSAAADASVAPAHARPARRARPLAARRRTPWRSRWSTPTAARARGRVVAARRAARAAGRSRAARRSPRPCSPATGRCCCPPSRPGRPRRTCAPARRRRWEAAAPTAPGRCSAGASLRACPVRGETGRAIGVLMVVSIDTARAARRRRAAHDRGARRPRRDGAGARRAARRRGGPRAARSCCSSARPRSCRPRSTPTRSTAQIAAHAAELTGASEALLTRLNHRSRRLRAGGDVGFSDEFAERAPVARPRRDRPGGAHARADVHPRRAQRARGTAA